MSCQHPQRRVRKVIVRGYSTTQVYCRECQVEAQRQRRARNRSIRSAFWQFATARWV